jgi:RsiW-degrading membrane proteinase PrsW (M82 family)
MMMADPDKPFIPPVPRDYEDASFSEMVPFRSSKINLLKSPLFLFALLAAGVVPFLFLVIGPMIQGPAQDAQSRINAVTTVSVVAVFFCVVVVQFMIYLYARTNRPIWFYFIAFAITAAIIHFPMLKQPFFWFFRQVLPGNYDPQQQYTFIEQFVKMFFAAGLCEEMIKAVPALLALALVVHARRNPEFARTGPFKFLQLRGPLDGVLLGVFAGGGFTFMETGFEYIPTTLNNTLQQTQDVGLAMTNALLLLLPRVFNGIVGHMAYAGVFGYFIGLAAIRPRQAWKLLAIGLVSAAVIHALWNSAAIIDENMYYAVTGLCAVMLTAVVLKARQLELVRTGGSAETYGSIVVDRREAPAMPPLHRTAPAPASPVPAAPVAFVPAAPAPATPQAAGEMPLALDIEGVRIPLRAGERIDLAGEPALGGRGAGVTGVVVPHPTRASVLGLRNDGAASWTARLRDGSRQMIEYDQSIRLAAGVEIDFQGGLFGAIVTQG